MDDCWCFAGVGVVEAMLRIEHGAWSLRSEGDVGDAISLFFGAKSKDGGSAPPRALSWIQENGIADPGCWPSFDLTQIPNPTQDRLGRTSLIDGYKEIGGPDVALQMKKWLDASGPIAVIFTCYDDLSSACKNDSVYVCSTAPSNHKRGGHCVIVVGYDDVKGAWLVRNSWGASWGTKGYGWFGYGQSDRGLEENAFWGVLRLEYEPRPVVKASAPKWKLPGKW